MSGRGLYLCCDDVAEVVKDCDRCRINGACEERAASVAGLYFVSTLGNYKYMDALAHWLEYGDSFIHTVLCEGSLETENLIEFCMKSCTQSGMALFVYTMG